MIFSVYQKRSNYSEQVQRIYGMLKITINLHHIMEFDEEPFEIEILNNNVIVHDMGQLVNAAIDYL